MEVTRQTVSKWERGVIAPTTEKLIALSRLYGVPLDELVNGEPQCGGKAGDRRKAQKTKPAEIGGGCCIGKYSFADGGGVHHYDCFRHI